MTVTSSSIDADERMSSRLQHINNNATMHKQPTKKLSKAEKRRMAAQIGWETRRKRMGRSAKRTKLASSNQQGTSASMQVARRTRAVSKTDTEASTCSEDDNGGNEESESEDTIKRPLSRSEAARLGWARRKKMLAAEQAEELSDEVAEDDEEEIEKKTLSRAEAARLGWQRRKQMLAEAKLEEERRRQAAKIGWEKRKKAQKQLAVSKAKGKKKTDRNKGYGATARARAAKRGWERRKLVLAGACLDLKDEEPQQKKNVSAEGQDRVSRENKRNVCAVISEPSTLSRSTEGSKSSKEDSKRIPAWLKSKPREGAKRSRRLAADSADSHEESVKKKNELVTFLKGRGWMEFHPSSRLGSGTATYGYIPSSIASFIRGGTVSKTVVLEHGKLGEHYALDYEGYGGLKEMIDRYGVDYSPCPTEDVLEISRKVLGNRNAMQVSLWDLGEDLPWKEVEQAEEKKMNDFQKMVESKKEKDETSDLLFVANILASISHAANDDRSMSQKNDNHDIVSDSSFSDNQCSGRKLMQIESSSSISNKSVALEANADSQKVVEDDFFSIQSQSDFRQWSFGIC